MIVGIATLSTVVSSTTMNAEMMTIGRVIHRRGSGWSRSSVVERSVAVIELGSPRLRCLESMPLGEVERAARKPARLERAQAVEDQRDVPAAEHGWEVTRQRGRVR